MKVRIILLLMIINGTLIAPVKAAAAEQAEEEEKKEQGIIPSGDPALARQMQEREWQGVTREQEIKRALSPIRGMGGQPIADPLMDIIADYDINLWLDKTVEIFSKQWQGHSLPVSAIAVSPDGEFMVTGSLYGTNVTVWNKEGNTLHTLKNHESGTHAIAISSDSDFVVAASGGILRIWNKEGKLLRKIKAHESSNGEIFAIAISPDNKWIITGSDDKTTRIWNTQTGALVRELKGNEDAVAVAITADGKKVITGSTLGTVRIWDITTGIREKILKTSIPIRVLTIVSGDRLLLWGRPAYPTILNMQTGKIEHRFNPENISALAVSPDSKWFVAGEQGRLNIGDMQTGKIVRSVPHTSDTIITSVAISQDGTEIIMGDQHGVIRILSTVASGKGEKEKIKEKKKKKRYEKCVIS